MQGKRALSKLMRAIGLMSGTSMDGIDVALLDTDGEGKVERGPGASYPYAASTRARIAAAIEAARELERRDDRRGILGEVDAELTRLHATAVTRFLAANKLASAAIDVIGFHGQTVLHRPRLTRRSIVVDGTAAGGGGRTVAGGGGRTAAGGSVRETPAGGGGTKTTVAANDPGQLTAVTHVTPITEERILTVQLGDGAALAEATGIDVVHDMRAADCAAGGQGAPLVPAYHRALAIGLRRLPLAFVNVGGVANITYVGGDGRLIAFDTGPGNALLDDLMAKRTGAAHDADGATAARGQAHDDYVAEYMRHSHFSLVPPKSLDRNAFALELVDALPLEDAAATLTAFTAASIGAARAFLPDEPALWIVCGGGRRNRTLMRMLAGHVQNAVVPAEGVSLDGDHMEAQAWAYLAVRCVKGLPITFPGTTGAPRPLPGGLLARARR